jgi:heme/copper-type cytochrome/quinol oxidase subunit 2
MASKLLSALLAVSLVAAPAPLYAQNAPMTEESDDEGGMSTTTIGVVFALLVGVVLIFVAGSKEQEEPFSP